MDPGSIFGFIASAYTYGTHVSRGHRLGEKLALALLLRHETICALESLLKLKGCNCDLVAYLRNLPSEHLNDQTLGSEASLALAGVLEESDHVIKSALQTFRDLVLSDKVRGDCLLFHRFSAADDQTRVMNCSPNISARQTHIMMTYCRPFTCPGCLILDIGNS